jgi:predicted ATP-grasp superfamily ATP-dependent carboligase
MAMEAECSLTVVDDKNAKGPEAGTPILVCFPSAGLASTIVGHYLIRSRNLPRCAVIHSPDLPPASVIIDSLPNPPIRVHGDSSVGIVVSEFPSPQILLTPLAEGILDWAGKRKSGLVVVVEGILKRQEEAEGEEVEEDKAKEGDVVQEAVIGIAATPEAKKLLESKSVPLLEDGIVGGLSAALLNAACIRDVPLVVLFATANRSDYPDHGAAARILEDLNKLLPSLKIDPQPLYAQAKIIEHALRDGMKLHAAVEPKPQTSPPEPSIYG